VISATIDKHVYITCKSLPNFFNLKYRIIYSKIENVNNISEIKHSAVRNALKYSNIKDGLELHYHGDLPARSGMGSSSSFLVGLLNLLSRYKNKEISKQKLAKDSINFEQKILRENVGSQDQIAASYGGFNSIKFLQNNTFKVKSIKSEKNFLNKLTNNLVLVYTGINRTAQHIAKSYSGNLISKKKNIITILEYVKEAKKIIEDQRLKDFGLLLHETWCEKKELSTKISNTEIDYLYNYGLKNGALGGKLLGAGGGGFLLFFVETDKKKFFIKKMKNFTTLPVKFSNKGSEIILR
jgi:D-glycero-alpha-D-manno-heptose-7-phosphate kinase